MSSTDIDQYLTLQDRLTKEHSGIDLEIATLETKLRDLKDRKILLDRALATVDLIHAPKPARKTATKKATPAKKKPPAKKTAAKRGGSTVKDDPNVAKLVGLLKETPGMDRNTIASHFPKLDNRALSLLLGKCKKRELIINTGGKRHPQWVALEKAFV